MGEAVEKPPLVAKGVPGAGFVMRAEAVVYFADACDFGRRGRPGEIENRVAARDPFIRKGACVDPDLEESVAAGGRVGKPVPRLGRAVEDRRAIDLEETPRRRAGEWTHDIPRTAERLPEHVTAELPGRLPTGDAQTYVLVQRECAVSELNVLRYLPGDTVVFFGQPRR